ncbi:MAG: GTP-binding protein, partial [Puniceicoccales bacterium]|nr:GTP-binding protein [Puniceicoccales bacterium]
RGIDQLESEMKKYFPRTSIAEESGESLTISVIGAPNVGKSSLINSMVQSSRMIVSDMPGTTRDSVATKFSLTDAGGKKWNISIIDTAGLRAFGKMDSPIEYFSSVRAREAVKKSNVVLLLLDAMRGLTKFDKKIAQEIWDEGKALMVVVNKWDLVKIAFREGSLERWENLSELQKDFSETLRRELFRWNLPPMHFVCAKTGENISKMLGGSLQVSQRAKEKISTGALNRFFEKCMEEREPVHRKGSTQVFKILYVLQTEVDPCVIRIYCNHKRLMDSDYESYLRNRLVREFHLNGCPVHFNLQERPPRNRKAQRFSAKN